MIEDILALVPVLDAAKAELRARLAEPSRHYHGTAHIALLWRRHLDHGVGLSVQAPPWHRLLACAIAYHDAIYDATRKDNEVRSAELWRAAAPALPPDQVAWVAGTILATASHLAARPEPGMAPESWAARQWMLDLDLTPLGEAPDIFDANTAALRREFAHLTDAQWNAGRAAFLHGIAATPRLLRTPVLYELYETQARANFARAASK